MTAPHAGRAGGGGDRSTEAGPPPALSAAAPVLDRLPEAVVVTDHAGRILYVNDAALRLLGHPAGALEGQLVDVIMPAGVGAAIREALAAHAETGHGVELGVTRRVEALHARGEEIAIELAIDVLDPAARGADVVYVGVLHDAGSRAQLERRVILDNYMRATAEVTHFLGRAESDDMFAEVLPTLCRRLDWDLAALWRPDADTEVLRCVDVWELGDGGPTIESDYAAMTRMVRLFPGQGLPGMVYVDGHAAATDELRRGPLVPRRALADAAGYRSAIAFPLVGRDQRVLGVVEFYARDPRQTGRDLLDLLDVVGLQLGQFLDRVATERALRQLAQTLQRSLLPPSLPNVAGLDLDAAYLPGRLDADVGGDFYDVFGLGDSTWGIVIGDVCGKGAAAADTTAFARYTLRAAALDHRSPEEALRIVNTAMLQEQHERPFLSCAYLVLRRGRSCWQATIAVAGHPLPLLRRADGAVETVGEPGTLLGIIDDVDLTDTVVELGDGDGLLLFTDGVTEARDLDGQFFGGDRLSAVVARTRYGGVVGAVVDAVADFTGPSGRRDDIALVAMRSSA